MGAITLDPWVLLERGTYIAALMAFIAALLMEWVIPGKQHRREIAAKDKAIEKLELENKELEHRVWEMLGLLKKSTSVAEKNSTIAEATITKNLPG